MSEKNKKKRTERPAELSLITRTTLVVFLCLVAAILLTVVLHSVATVLNWELSGNLFLYILLLLGISGVITMVAFRLFASKLMSYEQNIREILDEIAKGNFDVQIPLTKSNYANKTIEDINKVLQELKSVKIMRSDFVSNFSHEMKTPMVTINGFAELLLSDDVTEDERKEYARIIYDESKRLTTLAQSTLLMNKLNAQAIVQNKTEYSLDEQIRQCIAQFMQKINEKNLQIECDAEPVTFLGDTDLLQQVWINLFSNAIKFSPQGGSIFVTLKTEENNAVIRIVDEGCGMDEETLKHAFDQFYQGDSSHTTEGNGLGLSIVQRIVQLCEGNVTVRSRPDEGSTFTVRLPLEH